MLASQDPAVLTEMTDGMLRLTERLVQAGEVVMTVGETRVFFDRGLIGFERRIRAAGIF